MAKPKPIKVSMSLTPPIHKDLEAYAVSLGSTATTEATRIITNEILRLRDEGKIPQILSNDANSAGDARESAKMMQSFLKMLADGISVPDNIIQLLAKETELTEEELRGIRDRLSSK